MMIFGCLAAVASADTTQLPTRETFSLGYARMEKAIGRERPVYFSIRLLPRTMDGMQGAAMQVLAEMMAQLDISGEVRCYKEGGLLTAQVRVGEGEVLSVGQTRRDGRIGLALGDVWLSIEDSRRDEAVSMLALDEFTQSLMDFDYSGIRAGDTPFLTPLYEAGMRLWSLASPYCEDSNRLSVPSGATGHGVTYELDTQAVRTVLTQWAETLSGEGLSLGFAGTDLSLGVQAEMFDAFVQKVLALTEGIEVSKPLKFSTTFGEGDVLRTAKGSGAIRVDGKRSNVSYAYSCDLSSTRITRKYSVDFQPAGGDTLVLRCTEVTSSNNEKSGAHTFSLNASGLWDGEPYRLKIELDMANKYAADDAGSLIESIGGTASAQLTYAGATVFNAQITREASTQSTTGLTTPIWIAERYDALVSNDEGTLFDGVLEIEYDLPGGPQEQEDVLADALDMSELDFIALETLRETLIAALAQSRQAFLVSLAPETLAALLTTY